MDRTIALVCIQSATLPPFHLLFKKGLYDFFLVGLNRLLAIFAENSAGGTPKA
jgi:hypothetical protein